MKVFSRIVPLVKLAYGSLMVVLLLASFGLHAIQIAHEHQGANHHHSHSGAEPVSSNDGQSLSSLGEYMHAADKKLWIILPAPLFASLAVLLALCGSWLLLLEFVRRRVALVFYLGRYRQSLRRNYLNFLYSQGLHNPKLF